MGLVRFLFRPGCAARWLALVIVGFLSLGFVGHAQSSPASSLLGPVPVERVVDGDTVVVESNLGPRVIRLIGIDTPEVQHPSKGLEPFGLEASEFVKNLLPAGTPVWVELDVETEDAYGRLLAYLYVESPSGTWVIDDTNGVMVNLEIAEAGLARTLNIEPNGLYVDLFDDAVRAAQSGSVGMWSASEVTTGETEPPPSPVVAEAGDTVADSEVVSSHDVSIACVLYNPSTDGDEGAEVVTLMLASAVDTRGFSLYDEGSGTILRLPAGRQPQGELKVVNPGKGIWNNGGDTIYLRKGQETIDAWDYSDDVVGGEDETICRNQ